MSKSQDVWRTGLVKGAGDWLVGIHAILDGAPVPEPIGTGFVVGGIRGHRIALSAAHVFEEILARCIPHPLTSESRRVRAMDDLVRDRRIVAMLEVEEGTLTQHWVSGFTSYPGWDAAAFFIAPPKEGGATSIKCVQIDASIPAVGTEVAVMAYGGMAREAPFVIDSKRKGQIFSRRREIRIGRIVDVRPHGGRLVRAPCVFMDVPLTKGMSGGPILFWTGGAGKKTACAFVSSDFSTDDAHASGSVAGDSTGVLVAAALPLRFTLHFGARTETRTIQQLLAEGRVKEHGTSSRNWIISYPEGGVRMQWRHNLGAAT